LYCVEDEAVEAMQGRAEMRHHGIERLPDEDVVEELFGRTWEEFEERVRSGQVKLLAFRGGVFIELTTRGWRPTLVKRTPARCVRHVWEFDRGDLHRRHCVRPGCGARQVWRWLPDRLDRNGEWEEVPAQVITTSRVSHVNRRRKNAREANKVH
jgi:hypothetical protein